MPIPHGVTPHALPIHIPIDIPASEAPMKVSGSVLAALIVVTTTVGDGADRTSRFPDVPSRPSRLGARLPDPPNAPVNVGDRAPDFSWVGVDNRTLRLRDILEQANVLLVFAPGDDALRRLEEERETLGLMGVVPVAVLEARARGAVNRAKRTGVHFLVVPDPVRVIGTQFNMLETETNRTVPGWYAIDRRGTVRGAGTTMDPPQGWARIAASALAIPSPDVPLPARSR